MGGFILVENSFKKESIMSAKKTFADKGMEIAKEKIFSTFKLIIFKKINLDTNNYFEFGKDFIVSIGTALYKNLSKHEAAQKLYVDFSNSHYLNFKDFKGSYCFILYIDSKLYLFNDYNGTYHIFHDSNFKIFSTSFLSISQTIVQKNINTNSLYEYFFYGATYGKDTILESIKRVDSKYILRLDRKNKFEVKYFNTDNLDKNQNLNELLEINMVALNDYFKALTDNFNKFSLGLSGGFDSRLILSLLLKYDKKPFIYTSGNPNSLEVNISKSICDDYNLGFINYHENMEKKTNISLGQFVSNKFIRDDGFTVFGTFLSELDMDYEISQKSEINLNGGGGEIYREFWKLPETKININDFIKVKYMDFNFDSVTDLFNKETFFPEFGQKIISSLDFENNDENLNVIQTRLIYPNYRLKYWTGPGCKKINQYSYAILPFADPNLYHRSLKIPLKYRIGGKFEAELIRKISPALAKYNSNYSFNFYNGPNLKEKSKDWAKVLTPLWIRPFIRRIGHNTIDMEKIKEKGKEILGEKSFFIEKFINMDKIFDISMYSRALTLEYFFKKYL